MKRKLVYAGPINLPVLLKRKVAHFKLYIFRGAKQYYYALEKGDVSGAEWPLVRIHSACNLAHIFHSVRCDCQAQLELAMGLMHRAGQGLLIYALGHEGRGIGPFDHVRVYQQQDIGLDTVDSYVALGLPIDKRSYHEIGPILRWFKLKRIRLLTNSPRKMLALEEMGFAIWHQSLVIHQRSSRSQIKAKVEKLGHLIRLP